jgi:hypothetical protein
MTLRHRAAPPPLAEVRRRLCIEPAPVAHPDGILVDREGALLPTRPAAFGDQGPGRA